ncbi:MAG: DNA translocase FtsK 4TM domain-containing protein [Robiginitomaculum sp.]|nr:DNA translocase FtsK 4TM domain-containing protein [Robiginitomaculum sp.]
MVPMTDNTTFTNPNGFSLMQFVPRTIRRRVVGVLLFAVGVFLFGSFLDHAELDPSWNTASSQVATNIFGSVGSHISDLGLQLVGWGGYGLALSFLVWGAAYLLRPLRFKMYSRGQVFVALGSSLLFSIAASSLPVPVAWPFSSGLGGLFGDMVFLPIQSFLGGPFGGAALGVLCFILAVIGFIWAFSLQRSDAARIIDAAYEFVQKTMFLVRGFGKKQSKPTTTKKATDKPKRRKTKTKVAPAARARAGTRAEREKQLKMPFVAGVDFELPHLELLAEPKVRTQLVDEVSLRQNAELLETVLMDFGIKGQIVHVQPGPVVTLYELEPAPGLKSSRVISLSDDIARSMSAIACRVAVIPGRNVIGIELPNSLRETVFLRDTLSSVQFEKSKALLPLALGESISGEPYIADLARMPHMLVAGTTGSGKSVGINAMILSLLYRYGPDQCRFIMIDPKMLELSIYDGIPHLLSPVVTDPKKAVSALRWAVREMERRYKKMSKVGVRNVGGYNAMAAQAVKKGKKAQRTVQTGYDRESGKPIYETEELELEHLPFIVVVIDEMADLMMVAGKDIEGAVQRLAQMARAAGIHVVMATQRPSVDVITGTIKANFPTRISFQVSSKIDSRTILGDQGAEQLLGMGDMLYMAGGGRVRRLHGPFVSDKEVEAVTSYLKQQGAPVYLEEITTEESSVEIGSGFGDKPSGDDLYDKAVAIIARDRKASTSYLQRRLQIGYNRAATLIERLEDEGVVGAANHAGKREILLPEHDEM